MKDRGTQLGSRPKESAASVERLLHLGSIEHLKSSKA